VELGVDINFRFLEKIAENVQSTNINSNVSDISNKVVIDIYSRQVTTFIVA